MVGKVKWFNDENRYGFIEYTESEDIFIHNSAIELDGYKTLNQGEIVNYKLLKTEKDLQAKKILQVSSN